MKPLILSLEPRTLVSITFGLKGEKALCFYIFPHFLTKQTEAMSFCMRGFNLLQFNSLPRRYPVYIDTDREGENDGTRGAVAGVRMHTRIHNPCSQASPAL